MARPDRTDEDRERRMINYAIDLAEKQLRDGSASSAVLTHYLKLASTRASLEVEKLRNENALLQAKTKKIESDEERAQKYQEAIDAMRRYQGHGGPRGYEEELS